VIFLLVAVWLAFAFAVAGYAGRKGLDRIWYFLLAVTLSPLVGFIFAALAKPDAGKIAEESLATGTVRKCPFCAEIVKREAIVCRFCGRDLPPAPPPATEAAGLKCESCGGVSVPTA
jgi:hypothetical protein